ncbi:MAG: AzlD domain-containing protein [ANME-2 cluster archaeon]|nr:AzlD domain-containing protein [ANME-2 cluster archaeon]
MEKMIALTILLMALVTYIPRAFPLLLLTRFDLPEKVVQWLKYIPVAVLSALLFPSILLQEGGLDISNEFLVAVLPTILVVWRTRSLFWAIVTGIGAVSLLRLSGV